MEDPRPRSTRRHRLYVATAVVAVLASIGYALAALIRGRFEQDTVLLVTGVAAFTVVGALILDRRPGQPIGRMCLVVGVGLMAAGLMQLAAMILDDQPGVLPPLGAGLAMVSTTLFSSLILLSGPLLTSRFPDGASIGALGRVFDALVITVVAAFVVQTFRPGPIEIGWIESVPNPLGIDFLPFGSDLTFTIGIVGYAAASVIAGAGLVMRYRRGGPVLRAQIRWFAAAIGTTLVLLIAMVMTSDNPAISEPLWGVWVASLLLPPIAIAVSILRYNLYEIDRIISRTITYGFVSVVLFGMFAAVNVAVQSSVNPFKNAGPVVVAASTLLVAVLFNPVRRRVQAIVDRRFHRAQYDAEQMVDSLAARLRGEMDLTGLRDDILDVVHRSVEPASAVVWLRAGHSAGPGGDPS